MASVSVSTTHAFSTAAISGSRPRTQLHSSATDEDRIKKAGAGITTQTPGDLCFFDPNENGKLQGSNNLMDRVENGASFAISDAPETTSSAEADATPVETPAAAAPSPAPTPAATQTASIRNLTTNLRSLLNGQMDLGLRGRDGSQY